MTEDRPLFLAWQEHSHETGHRHVKTFYSDNDPVKGLPIGWQCQEIVSGRRCGVYEGWVPL